MWEKAESRGAELRPQIARCVALAAPPATQFAYGGLSMHVGGRMAEVASGQLWDALFAQRIAIPLGMTHTEYEGLGPSNNPRIDAGARSSLDDYGRFLEMLLGGGVFLVAWNLQQLRDEIQQIQNLERAAIAACTASAPPAVAATSAAGLAALVVALAAVSIAATRAGRPSRDSRR
jgi:CubicO group peptidase (beta-lactamase class C family)